MRTLAACSALSCVPTPHPVTQRKTGPTCAFGLRADFSREKLVLENQLPRIPDS